LKKLASIFLFISLLSCGSDDRVDDAIEFKPFPDIVFSINLPLYSALQVDGGHFTISTFNGERAGIRGIIIYRVNATTFRAFEQNCSLQPNDACATVEPFSIYMQDACCGSVFDYEGDPTGQGLAWRPLGQYETRISGSTLTITDNVINY
jgi:hypothetical protein